MPVSRVRFPNEDRVVPGPTSLIIELEMETDKQGRLIREKISVVPPVRLAATAKGVQVKES